MAVLVFVNAKTSSSSFHNKFHDVASFLSQINIHQASATTYMQMALVQLFKFQSLHQTNLIIKASAFVTLQEKSTIHVASYAYTRKG